MAVTASADDGLPRDVLSTDVLSTDVLSADERARASRFVFERVVPGHLTVCKMRGSRPGQSLQHSSARYEISVQAGKTTKVDLGTSGRPVVGQLRLSSKPEQNADVEGRPAPVRVHMFVTPETALHPGDPQSFIATADERGNFCIDDVPVGDYRMAIHVQAGGINTEITHFTVPAINEKLSQRPVDLGVITVNAHNQR